MSTPKLEQRHFDALENVGNGITTPFTQTCETIAEIPAILRAMQERDKRLVPSIIRELCETEPFDPEHPNAVCVSVDRLEIVLADYLLGDDQPQAPAAPEPATAAHLYKSSPDHGEEE